MDDGLLAPGLKSPGRFYEKIRKKILLYIDNGRIKTLKCVFLFLNGITTCFPQGIFRSLGIFIYILGNRLSSMTISWKNLLVSDGLLVLSPKFASANKSIGRIIMRKGTMIPPVDAIKHLNRFIYQEF